MYQRRPRTPGLAAPCALQSPCEALSLPRPAAAQVLPEEKFGRLAQTVGTHSLEALRGAGADEERFPVMEHVLQVGAGGGCRAGVGKGQGARSRV